MPEPTVSRLATPPGSVLLVRVAAEEADETFPFAEKLHEQTGLPVVILCGDSDFLVSTRREAEEALRRRIASRTGDESAALPALLLSDLTEDGWELVKVRP